MHCYTTICGLAVCWQLGQQCTSEGILCDLKPSLGRYKKQNFLNTDAKIFAEVLQNHLQLTQIWPFFHSVFNKIPIMPDPFPQPPPPVVSLSLLCGGSNIRTQYLQGLGSVFSEIKGAPPPHSPEVWIDFHWPWHSSAWTPTQSWSRQFCGGQQIFFGRGVATWWNASHMGTVFSSTPSGSGYWHHGVLVIHESFTCCSNLMDDIWKWHPELLWDD